PRIEMAHLPDGVTRTGERHSLALDDAVAACEKQHIREVLRLTDGNREEAAELLEIDPATLYRRLSTYDID
ncbi:MAG: helix-turn-helix domain-containing protein, partial [Bradymonadaceae bacterium]